MWKAKQWSFKKNIGEKKKKNSTNHKKEKIVKLGHIKTKNFCSSKNTIERGKNQPTEEKDIYKTYMQKGHMSSIKQKHLQFNKKLKNTIKFKELDKGTSASQEDSHIVYEQRKRWSTSPTSMSQHGMVNTLTRAAERRMRQCQQWAEWVAGSGPPLGKRTHGLRNSIYGCWDHASLWSALTLLGVHTQQWVCVWVCVCTKRRDPTVVTAAHL